jgi:pentatricopeptide repeat protein
MWKVAIGVYFYYLSCWGTVLVSSWSHSTTTSSSVYTRRIQAHSNNATNALLIAQQVVAAGIQDDKPIVEALRVCGNCNQPDQALEIFALVQGSDREQCLTMAISVLGACAKLDQALKLLDGATNIGPYNAAIAASGKAKNWETALKVYQMTVDRGITSGLTVNALLTILAQRRQGKKALEILSTAPCKPDRLTYQYTVSALVRSGMTAEAFELLQKVHQEAGDIRPTEAMWEVVTVAFSKADDRATVNRIERMRYPDQDPSTLSSAQAPPFQHWTGLVKVGRGKNQYWEIATIDVPGGDEKMVVGVHPNRHPSKNGIQIEFYEESLQGPLQRSKLGYVLVQPSGRESRLLGMFLNGDQRGQGLSKICLAFWFKLCLGAGVVPTTGIINKPLLALLLEQKFAMVPSGGVKMEISPDPEEPSRVILYAPSCKDLRGVFSPWDLRHQNLKLVQRAPEGRRGRKITVGATFRSPRSLERELQGKIDKILPPDTVQCKLHTLSEYQNVLFGREL